MLINIQGETVRLTITPGNCDDRAPVRDMLKGIKTKLIGDKGYLSQSLFDDLFQSGTTKSKEKYEQSSDEDCRQTNADETLFY